MRKLLLFLVIFSASGQARAAVGDLAVIAYNGADPDRFRVLALANIPGNVVYAITDYAWTGTGFNGPANEGFLYWTTPAGGIPAGTVVLFDASSNVFSNGGTVSHGSFTVSNALFNLSTLGDNLFIYQGTIAPTTGSDPNWVWGLAGVPWITSGTTSATSTYQPSALVGYSVAMVAPAGSNRNADFYYANGTSAATNVTISGSRANIIASLTDNSRYYRNEVASAPTSQVPLPTYNATVLPLKLLSFAASHAGSLVRSSWTTADERQVDRMELQRSADGRSFEKVSGTLPFNTPGNHAYEATDKTPFRGRSYYRLATVNADGSVQYSGTISVTAPGQPEGLTLMVSPNPVRGTLSLLHSPAGAAARLTLCGADGRVVATRQAVPGSTTTHFCDLDLPLGYYLAVYEDNGEKIASSFVK